MKSRKFIYPISADTWQKEELKVAVETLRSGNLTNGSKVLKFESNFAKYLKRKYCVMVNSGSSANLLMVASLFFLKNNKKINSGDEVIVPAVS